jgi:glyoxylase-like metal-dependent hydrolase (beta-lactamase superfamily II)
VGESTRGREAGRGERVVPGLWRLRLPMPWPGVPHGNAWAVKAGDGVVLFDCGYHDERSPAELERALAMCGLRLEDVRLLVCTHAHEDHYGEAAAVLRRAGCELWMHPRYEHARARVEDEQGWLAARIALGRASGVPEEPLACFAARFGREPAGIEAIVAPDRELLDGVVVETDLGPWVAYETPGHAPSHVCLFQPDRRMLISGDHVLGRVTLYFDYGYTPDPVGEFLASLDKVEALRARLALSGHGRTFADVQAHVDATRALVARRLASATRAIAERGPICAYELAAHVYDDETIVPEMAAWRVAETLCYLAHLELRGDVARERDDGLELWRPAGG